MTSSTALADKKQRMRQASAALRSAGYVPISRPELAAARLKLSDVASARPRVLTQRPISLRSKLPGRAAGPMSLELTVATTRETPDRAAVELTVRYFSALGRPLPAKGQTQYLFGDPLKALQPQPVYLDPPAEARWVEVTITRRTGSQRIGMLGSLRPAPLLAEPGLDLESALASRDVRALRSHLTRAAAAKDRAAGRRIYERLLYLAGSDADRRGLRALIEAEQLLSLSDPDPFVDAPGGPVHRYQRLLSDPPARSELFQKWLACEAASLQAAACGKLVSLLPGAGWNLRRLVALKAGLPVEAGGGPEDDPADIPWISATELVSFFERL